MKFQDASWGRDGGSISRSRAKDGNRSSKSSGYLFGLTAPASERSSHPPCCQTSRRNMVGPNSAHGHKGPEYVTTYFLGGCWPPFRTWPPLQKGTKQTLRSPPKPAGGMKARGRADSAPAGIGHPPSASPPWRCRMCHQAEKQHKRIVYRC